MSTRPVNPSDGLNQPAQSQNSNTRVRQIPIWETRLDGLMPNFWIQTQADQLGAWIESLFAPFTEFNQWLEAQGHGGWARELATYLAKLPLKVARNIVLTLYQAIYAILYSAVHPIKAVGHAANLLVNLVYELADPKSWSRVGCGMAGSMTAYPLAIGQGPIPLIALQVAGALTLAGLTLGPLKAAMTESPGGRSGAVQNFLDQITQMPEAFGTGFATGYITGTIQKRFFKTTIVGKLDQKAAEKFAKQFAKENGLPPCDQVTLTPDGKVILDWSYEGNLEMLEAAKPEIIHPFSRFDHPNRVIDPLKLSLELEPHKTTVRIQYIDFDGWEGTNHTHFHALGRHTFKGAIYPEAPVNRLGFNLAANVAAVEVAQRPDRMS